VLMTKFGKAEKTGCFGFLFRIVQFLQFQGQAKKEAKLDDLKIQGSFKHGKWMEGIEGPR
jgi:hypothetical protein